MKIAQISRKNPGEHPAEGHIEIYGPEVAGNEGEGTPRGTLLEFTDFSCKHFQLHLVMGVLENRHLVPTLQNFTF